MATVFFWLQSHLATLGNHFCHITPGKTQDTHMAISNHTCSALLSIGYYLFKFVSIDGKNNMMALWGQGSRRLQPDAKDVVGANTACEKKMQFS